VRQSRERASNCLQGATVVHPTARPPAGRIHSYNAPCGDAAPLSSDHWPTNELVAAACVYTHKHQGCTMLSVCLSQRTRRLYLARSSRRRRNLHTWVQTPLSLRTLEQNLSTTQPIKTFHLCYNSCTYVVFMPTNISESTRFIDGRSFVAGIDVARGIIEDNSLPLSKKSKIGSRRVTFIVNESFSLNSKQQTENTDRRLKPVNLSKSTHAA